MILWLVVIVEDLLLDLMKLLRLRVSTNIVLVVLLVAVHAAYELKLLDRECGARECCCDETLEALSTSR